MIVFPSHRLPSLILLCLLTSANVQAQSSAPASDPPSSPAAPPAPVSPAPTSAPAASPTLELPLLVVDHQHRPVEDVHLDQLKVKIGNREPFAPSAMHREGEEPVSLAILLDASRDSFNDLSQVGPDIASLVGSQLLPNDRVSLYAIDCSLVRSLSGAQPESAVLAKAVKDAFASPGLHGGKPHSSCGKTVHLWDDVAAVAAGLSHAPGRRVILLLSSGADGASKYDWLTVQQYAFDQGVAIFGLRDKRQADADDFSRNSLSVQHGSVGYTPVISPTAAPRAANNLELLCANSGGLTLSASPEFRKDAIADILFLLRNRFILTIPRDAYLPATSHSAKVTQSILTPYYMTASGATDPLPTTAVTPTPANPPDAPTHTP